MSPVFALIRMWTPERKFPAEKSCLSILIKCNTYTRYRGIIASHSSILTSSSYLDNSRYGLCKRPFFWVRVPFPSFPFVAWHCKSAEVSFRVRARYSIIKRKSSQWREDDGFAQFKWIALMQSVASDDAFSGVPEDRREWAKPSASKTTSREARQRH